MEKGKPPEIDLDQENRAQEVCLEAINSRLVQSAHDCSEGGLAIAIAESLISGPIIMGAEISLESHLRNDTLLFSESQSRIVLSANEKNVDKIASIAKNKNVPFQSIGSVINKSLIININSMPVINMSCDKFKKSWKDTLRNYMDN